jgi:hypothetical protein
LLQAKVVGATTGCGGCCKRRWGLLQAVAEVVTRGVSGCYNLQRRPLPRRRSYGRLVVLSWAVGVVFNLGRRCMVQAPGTFLLAMATVVACGCRWCWGQRLAALGRQCYRRAWELCAKYCVGRCAGRWRVICDPRHGQRRSDAWLTFSSACVSTLRTRVERWRQGSRLPIL